MSSLYTEILPLEEWNCCLQNALHEHNEMSVQRCYSEVAEMKLLSFLTVMNTATISKFTYDEAKFYTVSSAPSSAPTTLTFFVSRTPSDDMVWLRLS